jgi:D-alanyl-D-alanine carboxypeptidase
MLLGLLLCAVAFGSTLGGPLDDGRVPPLSPLARQLSNDPQLWPHSDTRDVTSVFGLPAGEARVMLLPVSHEHALPEGYVPPDLVRFGGHMVRGLIVPDLTAMVDAAAAEGVDIAVISGYRSPTEQTMAFETAVWQAIGRSNYTLDRSEAEARATRFVAPPGRSQHQLGTTIDFSTNEIGYGIHEAFAETGAGRWLAANAWQFGFVLPYPQQGEQRSGYAYEPWHYRWIGHDLAGALERDQYMNAPDRVVDDYLRAVQELLVAAGVP